MSPPDFADEFNSPFEREHLDFLVQEAVERFLRLEGFLREVGHISDDQDQHLSDLFRSGLRSASSVLEGPISFISSLDRKTARLQPRAVRNCLNALRAFNEYFSILHLKLPLFVSLPRVVPEAYLFLGSFYDRGVAGIGTTLAYTNLYNFAELDLYLHLRRTAQEIGSADPQKAGPQPSKPDKEVVLLLPCVSRGDPLIWVNLLHELAHAFADKLDIAGKILGDRYRGEKPALDLTRRWITEHFADHFSLRLAGPAYMCAFIKWLLAGDPKYLAPTESHPPPVSRVRQMDAFLDKSSLHTKSSEFMKALFYRLDRSYGPPSGRESLPSPLLGEDSMLAEVEEAFEENVRGKAVEAFGLESLAASQAQMATFSRGILIASRNTSEPDESHIRALATSPERMSPGQFYKEASAFEQIPNHPSVILNVAWLNRTTGLLSTLRQGLCGRSDSFDSRVTKFAHTMEDWDAKVQKSIEIARIHSLWREASQKLDDANT